MKLEAREISFRYDSGSRQVLNHASLSMESGERVGLTAPSGFGKTTLCRILAGYERPDAGEVLLDGKPFFGGTGLRGYQTGTMSFFRKSKLPVQLIWQHPELAVNPWWRVSEVLREGGRIDPGLIKRLGIKEEWMDRFPSELSGGELQRLCIARALGEGTEFLLADEITAMLDLVTQKMIWQVLLEETEKRRIGMLIVSHSEALLNQICTRRIGPEVLVMKESGG